MDDDNIFDEDDALDYIMFEEHSRGSGNKNNNVGCLSVFVIAVLPVVSVGIHLFDLFC